MLHITLFSWEATRDVLNTVENKIGSTTISKYDYTVNSLGQRTEVDSTGQIPGANNRGWEWGYNTSGEVNAATHQHQTALNRAYVFDALGNRTSTTEGTGGGAQTTSYTPRGRYTWGLDLSGSLQGVGGVGGLLASKIDATTYYPTYDGNGNVSEYLNGSGTVVAHYEYNAYGNIMNALTGLAPSFNIRFSIKYIDRSTAFYYYGFRYYQPFIGRWLSRDPIGEIGGANIYGILRNNTVNRIDLLGLWDTEAHNEIIDDWMMSFPFRGMKPCGCCGILDLGQMLKDASARADGLDPKTGRPAGSLWNLWKGFRKVQGSGTTAAHAMRNTDESVEEGRRNFDSFVNDKILEAKTDLRLAKSMKGKTKCSAIKKAIEAIGRALHAIADSHSPAHRGFQSWPYDSSEDAIDRYPGPDQNRIETMARHGDWPTSIERAEDYKRMKAGGVNPVVHDM